MFVGHLPLPRLLASMLAEGRWPRDEREAIAQNLAPRTSAERVRALAAEEERIYLLPPPFHGIRALSRHNMFWTMPESAPDGIDFDLAVEIADFGLGSDAPILLDYRPSIETPCVIRLKWSEGGVGNRWVPMAESFDRFVAELGL
jgi:hypothetical protein